MMKMAMAPKMAERSIQMDDLIECSATIEPMKIEKYQKKGAAFEFKERQEYFKGQFKSLSLNKFWVKAIDTFTTSSQTAFVGEEVIDMINSSLEIILALALTDLPLERGVMDSQVTGGSLSLTSTANILVFCKRMEERKPIRLAWSSWFLRSSTILKTSISTTRKTLQCTPSKKWPSTSPPKSTKLESPSRT